MRGGLLSLQVAPHNDPNRRPHSRDRHARLVVPRQTGSRPREQPSSPELEHLRRHASACATVNAVNVIDFALRSPASVWLTLSVSTSPPRGDIFAAELGADPRLELKARAKHAASAADAEVERSVCRRGYCRRSRRASSSSSCFVVVLHVVYVVLAVHVAQRQKTSTSSVAVAPRLLVVDGLSSSVVGCQSPISSSVFANSIDVMAWQGRGGDGGRGRRHGCHRCLNPCGLPVRRQFQCYPR